MIEETMTLETAAVNLVPCTNCGKAFPKSEMTGHDSVMEDEISIWYCDECVAMIKDIFPDEDDFYYGEDI